MSDLARVLDALSQAHREQLAQAAALLVLYREFIEDHGLEPPTQDGREALERFRNAFRVAGYADTLQHPELVADWTKEEVAA